MWLGMLSRRGRAGLAGARRPVERARRPAAGVPDRRRPARAAGVPYAAVPVRLGSRGRGSRSRSRRRSPSRRRCAAAERRLPPAGLGRRAVGLRPAPLAAALGCVAVVAVLGWRHAHPGCRAGPASWPCPFLDVGQGDATLIQDGDGTAVLFDGGPPEAARPARAARRGRAAPRRSSWPRTSRATIEGGAARRAGAAPRPGCCSTNGDGTARPRTSRRLLRGGRRPRDPPRTRPRRARCCRSGGCVVRVLAPAPRPRRRAAGRATRTRAASPRSSAPATSTCWLSADAESDVIRAAATCRAWRR